VNIITTLDVAQRPSVVALGVFDGLHLGHRALLSDVVARARAQGAAATVVTFDAHPLWTVAPDRAPQILATLEQRLEGFERLGIDQVVVLAFTEAVAEESPEEFVARVLVGQLGAITVVAGDDTGFGRDRQGDTALLLREGARHGFSVVATATLGPGRRWSSSWVRHLLREGDVAGAATVLGCPFVLRGEVVHGDARGREIGFPTANLVVGPHQALPVDGVYAAAVALASGEWRAAAVSVGTRPQFYESGELLVEVHLPGFQGDLYGQRLDVAFLERLRGQETYGSLEELIAQIGRDVAATQEIFQKFPSEDAQLLGWNLGQRR
jgi:riboflavin kinase/FMN adenylyltransferase